MSSVTKPPTVIHNINQQQFNMQLNKKTDPVDVDFEKSILEIRIKRGFFFLFKLKKFLRSSFIKELEPCQQDQAE